MSGDLDWLDFLGTSEYHWECLATEYSVNEASKVKKITSDQLLKGHAHLPQTLKKTYKK